jgi:hypothetical protein
MKITLLNGITPEDLKSTYPKSMYLDDRFDEYILGFIEISHSIIYNIYGVIHQMIEDEFPEIEEESDEWFDCYDEINEGLCFGDGLYGLENLQDYMEGNTGYYNTDFPPYTFCFNLEIINYDGTDKSIKIPREFLI